MNAERERWRKVNWGYPPEFIEAEKEYLGIAPETPQPSGDDLLNFQKRLDYQQTEIADLRNRINNMKPKSVTVTKPIGGITL
jgi:hypothetical protein